MLCQFTFKNYKSYKNEVIFDLQATAIPEFENELLKSEKADSLLPVSVIYGPNGGGKSNLLSALSCLIYTVVKPINELKKGKIELTFSQQVDCIPFTFDDNSKNEPTEFEIFFRTSGNEYRYNLILQNDVIIEEYLYRKTLGGKKSAVIFERYESKISLGATIDKPTVNTDVNPKMPYLSFLAINYNFDTIIEVQKWFESCILRSEANPVTESDLSVIQISEIKSRVIELLNDMDIDITDYRFDKSSNHFYFERKINDKKYELDFAYESEGTKKLVGILPILLIALQEGRLAIIDELDSKLHPKLLRYIIMLFKNTEINKNCAQLIFTSHDMSTMKNDVFRRDEIWFAAKDKEESSELYSLYEIRREDNKRINNTAAYDKQYLEGRYGADPYLVNILNWEV